MKGYKGMNADMTCRGMKYEVGKTYHIDGEIKACKNGLHFCKRLINVFDFYEKEGHRFFEVEASGVIKEVGDKHVASDLKIIRELSDVEINRIAYGNGNGCGNSHSYGYGGDGFGDSYGGDGFGGGNGNGYGGDGFGNSVSYGYGGNGYGNDKCIQRILIFK